MRNLVLTIQSVFEEVALEKRLREVARPEPVIITRFAKRLSFGELESLAGALLAVFLSLDHAGISSKVSART